MRYTITIALKEGMPNPEARVIRHALANPRFATGDLSTGRLFRNTLDAADAAAAHEEAARMGERPLANPVIHHYTIEVA